MMSARDWLSPKAEIVFWYLSSLSEQVVHVLGFLKRSRVIFISVLKATQETEENKSLIFRTALWPWLQTHNLCCIWGEHDNRLLFLPICLLTKWFRTKVDSSASPCLLGCITKSEGWNLWLQLFLKQLATKSDKQRDDFLVQHSGQDHRVMWWNGEVFMRTPVQNSKSLSNLALVPISIKAPCLTAALFGESLATAKELFSIRTVH